MVVTSSFVQATAAHIDEALQVSYGGQVEDSVHAERPHTPVITLQSDASVPQEQLVSVLESSVQARVHMPM